MVNVWRATDQMQLARAKYIIPKENISIKSYSRPKFLYDAFLLLLAHIHACTFSFTIIWAYIAPEGMEYFIYRQQKSHTHTRVFSKKFFFFCWFILPLVGDH